MNSVALSRNLIKPWLSNKTPIAFTAVRNHWNKDYKPGPYPLTKEERLAAAKKYGIPAAEYEPYPDDGTGYGDYPKLPLESLESKDPYYPYDFPELKRNFQEPIHTQIDLIREDRQDVSLKLRRPLWFMWLQFFGTLAGFFGLYLIGDKFKAFHATIPRQFPKEGKVHYTFEPEQC